MTTATKTARVYLVHVEQDADLARDIARRLRLTGIDLVPRGKLPRNSIDASNQLKRAMDASDAVLFLITPAALASDWLVYEHGMAYGLSKLIMIVTAGVQRKQLPEILQADRIVPFDRLDDMIQEMTQRFSTEHA